jgi:hypothetical protein
MKHLKKTALAAAICSVAASQTFAVVDYAFEAGSETVVLASEIFGDETGTGSEETLIVMNVTELDLDTAIAGLTNDGDNINQNVTATVKFTLGGAAVFAEDLSTTAAVLAANGGAGAFTCTAGPVGAVVADSVTNDSFCGLTANADATFTVTQGGAIGDNTITFAITTAAAGGEQSIGGVTFGNVAIKNLTSALGDQGDSAHRGSVEMGVEYVEGAETTADTITSTATDSPLVIFGSQPGLDLDGVAVDFQALPFTRINVGGGELTFTDDVTDGRTDFDATGEGNVVELGTLILSREAIDTVAFPAANAGTVKKENGDDFDFQGGDTHSMVITASSGSFQVGGTVFLDTIGQDCANVAGAIANMTGESTTVAADGTASFTLTGTTTELTTNHELCYAANATPATNIPEVDGIAATWTVNFFNTRYDDQATSHSAYGPLLRNGCIASFFNIPSSTNNADTAYIRLSNTSTTNEGDIRGTLYAQDGTVLGEDVTVAPNLAIHATQVFSSEGADRTAGTGEEILDIETAFGLDPADGDYLGRARLVLKGAFDTCEGLGLIRSSATGALYNMSSTTQGNEAAAPNDGNNAN